MYNLKSFLGKVFPLLTVLCLMLYGCDTERDVNPSPDSAGTGDEITTLSSFLAAAVGVESSKVVFTDGNTFTIDQDMLLTLDEARAHYAKAQRETNASGRTEQRRHTYIISAFSASIITVYIEPDVPAEWVTATRQAIDNWNATDTKVRLSITSVAPGAINVSLNYGIHPDYIAQAKLPTADGAPGNELQINPYHNGIPATRKQFAMTHEMGHNLGLMHTNVGPGDVIPGTPTNGDPNSVMNSVVLDWNGFTFYDYLAIGILYPNNVFAKRFLRYVNTGTTDHFYTTSSTELGPGGSDGWLFEGSEGYLLTAQASGTVPLYRWYNTTLKDHFYTTNPSEITPGAPGWRSEGIAGYVQNGPGALTRPLFRYVNLKTSNHFYTLDPNEIAPGAAEWRSEGIACYVW